MTDPLIGARIRLRIYVPGDKISEIVTGTISGNDPGSMNENYMIKLYRRVRIYEDEFTEVCFIPRRQSLTDTRENRMLEVFQNPVHGTLSWISGDGMWTSLGDKGTFAEVSLLQ